MQQLSAKYKVFVLIAIFYVQLKFSSGAPYNHIAKFCENGTILCPVKESPQGLTIAFYDCNLPPDATYAAAMKAISIDLTDVATLMVVHTDVAHPPIFRAQQLAGLKIDGLYIYLAKMGTSDVQLLLKDTRKVTGYNTTNVNSNTALIDVEFIKELELSLTDLHLYGVSLSPLPQSVSIQNVNLAYGVSRGGWGECGKVKMVRLDAWTLSEKTEKYLAHCSHLRSLKLANLELRTIKRALEGVSSVLELTIACSPLETLTNDLLADAVSLETLKINRPCDERITNIHMLETLTNLLADAVSLQKLMMNRPRYKRITDIHIDAFQHHKKLRTLNLSNNRLTNPGKLAQALEKLPSLHSLYLNRIPGLDFCAMRPNAWSHATLQTLYLSKTTQSLQCLGSMPNLNYLDLSYNEITELQLTLLPYGNLHQLTINLHWNPITRLYNSKKESDELKTRYYKKNADKANMTVKLHTKKFDCDCLGHTARALQSLPSLDVHTIKCAGDTILEKTPPEQLECDVWACGPCTCRRRWVNQSVTANCAGVGLNTLPIIPGLRILNAKDNDIATLGIRDIPDTLEFADLRRNRIAYMDSAAAAALLSSKRRHVMLAENPLVCTCANFALIVAMHRHQAQISDFDNVTCVGGMQKVKSIDVTSVCSKRMLEIPLAIALAFTVAALAAYLVYRKWKYPIFVWLYSRGYCLCWLPEESLDTDLDFDAFVSFCHEDDDMVGEHILPALRGFRLCIHYRDWVAGEWIPNQVATSIARSRRTVIVVSQRYTQSLWGMLEFRMAHAAMLREGSWRLVAVVLDDVTETPELDAELQGYLSAHTYLKYGDPWFERKLRYAMPHRVQAIEDSENVDPDQFRAAVERYKQALPIPVNGDEPRVNNGGQ